MNKSTLIIFAFAVACLFESSATAQRVDNTQLHAAATRYRASVVNFEKVVVSTRGIVRSDERVVDKFEEATLRVVNAAKNPRHANRLRTEYSKTLPLQEKAVQSIFGRYTHNHNLAQAYEYVLYCQAMFEYEYQAHIGNPRHANRVTRLPKTQTFRQVVN